MGIPRRVWIVCGTLSAVRIALFLVIYLSGNTYSAQWQLAYVPFLFIDLPASIIYLTAGWPVPVPEAIVGPLWWFFMPLGVWWLVWGRRKRKGTATMQSNNRWRGP